MNGMPVQISQRTVPIENMSLAVVVAWHRSCSGDAHKKEPCCVAVMLEPAMILPAHQQQYAIMVCLARCSLLRLYVILHCQAAGKLGNRAM